MCCNTGSHQGFHQWGQGACCCHGDEPQAFRPRFMTKERRISVLKDHIETLRDEAKAAEEYIAQLKKEK